MLGSVKSKFGPIPWGSGPVDQGKMGWKWSMLTTPVARGMSPAGSATERAGIPGWATDGANRHDVILAALPPACGESRL